MAGLVLQVRNRAPQEAQGEIEADAVRVGFTVTKKVGNSVIRNRVRRRLRAVADEVLPVIVASGLDLVIIGRAGTIRRPYLALVKDLKTALKKLKANKCAWRERLRHVMSWLTKALNLPLRLLIRGYQLLISPYLAGSCRFEPTCSSFALDALDQHGPFWGAWLALKRILRCRPFGGYGYDPVPETYRLSGNSCHAHSHKKVLVVKWLTIKIWF